MINKVFIYAILFYQKCISPITGQCCRFTPSCSSYAVSAFRSFGFFKACFLAAKRLAKCHPFHPGGYDPL